MRAISLAFHDVTDGLHGELAGHKALYKLSREAFRHHMRSIQARAPKPAVCSFQLLDREKTPLFLTFDDGELGAYRYVADELEQYGWRGHFFITTDWIGRPGFLDGWQIRELRSRGHIIGSHSCSHPERMSHLPWTELMREWSRSCSVLSDLLGEEVQLASVPNGFYSRKVGSAAAAAGIQILFTSEATASVSRLDDCLILGRYFIQIHTPPAESGAIAASRIWPRWRQTALWKGKKVFKALMGESYFALRRRLLPTVLNDSSMSTYSGGLLPVENPIRRNNDVVAGGNPSASTP